MTDTKMIERAAVHAGTPVPPAAPAPTPETLTAEERSDLLEFARPLDVAKALRIIDAHAAERAALVERAERAETLAKAADENARHCTACVVQAEQTADELESERNALAATLERVRAVVKEKDEYFWSQPNVMQHFLSDLRAALAGAPAPEGDKK